MKNYLGKNILIALIVICFAIIASAFILYIQQNTKPVSNSNLDPFGHPWPIPSPPRQDEWKKTAVYHNEKYHYSITYPSHLSMYEFRGAKEDVYFEDETSVGVLYIKITATKYHNVDEELASENSLLLHKKDNYGGVHWIIEKRIRIDEYYAIVTYSGGNNVKDFPVDSSPNEKTTLFIKDNFLFRISTRGIDHERIWNSFKFE